MSAVRAVVEPTVEATIVVGLIGAAGLLVLLLVRRAFRPAAFWGLAVAGAIVFPRVLKELVERPEIGTRLAEYSFPSGNATASLAGILALTLLLRSSRLRSALVIAGFVAVPSYGLALVVLLWHYPSDVAGGWALGTAWIAALRLAFGSVRGLP